MCVLASPGEPMRKFFAFGQRSCARVLPAQSMTKGIAAGAALSANRSRATAASGIGAIGGNLLFCGHGQGNSENTG
jgi:hypothetical protein